MEPAGRGVVARPWGDKSTNRGKDNVDVDSNGNPLWFDSDKQIVDTIQRVAETRGVSMAQVAMAWVLKNPFVHAPIVGATKEHHLTDAAAALDLTLTDDEITALEQPYVLRESRLGSDPRPARACCLLVVPQSRFHTTAESRTDA